VFGQIVGVTPGAVDHEGVDFGPQQWPAALNLSWVSDIRYVRRDRRVGEFPMDLARLYDLHAEDYSGEDRQSEPRAMLLGDEYG
jgi:hypothetical protein